MSREWKTLTTTEDGLQDILVDLRGSGRGFGLPRVHVGLEMVYNEDRQKFEYSGNFQVTLEPRQVKHLEQEFVREQFEDRYGAKEVR